VQLKPNEGYVHLFRQSQLPTRCALMRDRPKDTVGLNYTDRQQPWNMCVKPLSRVKG